MKYQVTAALGCGKHLKLRASGDFGPWATGGARNTRFRRPWAGKITRSRWPWAASRRFRRRWAKGRHMQYKASAALGGGWRWKACKNSRFRRPCAVGRRYSLHLSLELALSSTAHLSTTQGFFSCKRPRSAVGFCLSKCANTKKSGKPCNHRSNREPRGALNDP